MSVGSLGTLQRRFWQLITTPSGVSAGIEELTKRDPGMAPLSSWIAADEATAQARLDVYGNMYFYRLLNSLQGDFPACEKALGAERFHNLVTDYLIEHPPDDPSLRYVGRDLPGYLDTHEVARAQPYLGDLARLEWARVHVFDAEDTVLLTKKTLGQLPPERWSELPLRPTPALCVLKVDFAVHEGCQQSATTLVIWRKGFSVQHRALETDEAVAFTAMGHEGIAFGQLCVLLAADALTLEESAQRAATLLARWVAAEMLALPE
ncbi:MAG: putative DNA-binding domain-containing protein, partial [Deltaproteobacteria bacterium]|nr:putative DNA-binding domain-containing protein [Deltaproteobacteria bacterium]